METAKKKYNKKNSSAGINKQNRLNFVLYQIVLFVASKI